MKYPENLNECPDGVPVYATAAEAQLASVLRNRADAWAEGYAAGLDDALTDIYTAKHANPYRETS